MRRVGGPLVLLVVAFVVVAAVLEAVGPFAPHPRLAYDAFIDDVAAGRVERVVWWRDRAEVTRADGVFSVRIPEGADFPDEFYAAHGVSQTGISYSQLPDTWVWAMTPIVPALLVAGALVILGLGYVRRLRPDAGTAGGAADGAADPAT